jgi:hypothetical protein
MFIRLLALEMVMRCIAVGIFPVLQLHVGGCSISNSSRVQLRLRQLSGIDGPARSQLRRSPGRHTPSFCAATSLSPMLLDKIVGRSGIATMRIRYPEYNVSYMDDRH